MGSSKSDKTPTYEDVVEDTIKDRRLKKRELDRKAQRMARERTKNRITHLEAMVTHFQQSDADSRVLSLMDHLSQVTSDRDKLLNAFESLTFTIQGHIKDATRGAERVLYSPTIENMPALSPQGRDATDPVLFLDRHASSIPTADAFNGFLDPRMWLDSELGVPTPCGGLPNGELLDELLNGSGASQDITILPTLPDPYLSDVYPPEDVIIPTATSQCHCVISASGNPTPDINLWRAANEALTRPTALCQSNAAMEDMNCQDTVIRAIVEGWNSVENKCSMTESWCKLRKLDEMGWHKCRPTERLAVLTLICLMIEYRRDPSPTRQASLPRWLWTRPSQTLPHSHAIDFFVWPGLRERFIFFQHQYCANLFWHLFISNFRILWPFDFRDTYMQNAETGQFQLSPHFEQCISKLDAWKMAPDFFKQFPELYDDIAVYSGS
ncbi:hypothetical protein B0J13DRAFT_567650 [Dactylonectria estremocensis]|uniref:BZIP domain-containing protein n=1 Tax=Dactylonectria estremocensis TaxID=1079267 RepID=A0A9P9IFR0_9HYPO|nr:hypothetical protein B0J13DRAFT_567650 [Dactylonectria estremocensis]